LKFQIIEPRKLDDAWPIVGPLLNKAVSLSNHKLNIDDLKQHCDAGAYLCWAVIDDGQIIAAVTSRIIDYPQSKALSMDFVGGSRMREWLPLAVAELKKHAKRNECSSFEAYGRRAWEKWLKPYGWMPTEMTYEMDLTNG
jgi:hypothetical protein